MRIEHYAVTLFAVALAAAPAQAEFFNSGGDEEFTFDTLAFAEVSNGTDVRFFHVTVLDDILVHEGSGSQIVLDDCIAISVIKVLGANSIDFPRSSGEVVSVGSLQLDAANANINGGTFREVRVTGTGGTLLIFGGRFGAIEIAAEPTIVVIKGGVFLDKLMPNPFTTMEIHGLDFRLDGAPVPFGSLTMQGVLTGVLQNGDLLDVLVEAESTSPIELVEAPIPAPEPATMTILGFGLAYLAALTAWRMH